MEFSINFRVSSIFDESLFWPFSSFLDQAIKLKCYFRSCSSSKFVACCCCCCCFYWLVINLCVLAINTWNRRTCHSPHLNPVAIAVAVAVDTCSRGNTKPNQPLLAWLTTQFRLSVCPPASHLALFTFHSLFYAWLMWFCTQLKTTWLNFHVKLRNTNFSSLKILMYLLSTAKRFYSYCPGRVNQSE